MSDTDLKEELNLRQKFSALMPYMNSKLEAPENSSFEHVLNKDIHSLKSLISEKNSV